MAAPPPPIAHRFFFALKPDEETARRTYAFAEQTLGQKGLLPAAHHHVTLGLTGDFADVPADLVERLSRAGEHVAAPPFPLLLDRLAGSHRTVALRPGSVPPALKALQKSIASAMAAEGVPMRQGWTFSPHETLAYRKEEPFTRLVTGFLWDVADFVLVHSHVGLTRHETIGRWPLRPIEPAQFSLL